MIVTPSGSLCPSLPCSHCDVFNKQTLLGSDFRKTSGESQGERNHHKVTKIMSCGLKFTVSGPLGALGVFHMKGQIGSQRDIKGKISHMNTPLFQKKK